MKRKYKVIIGIITIIIILNVINSRRMWITAYFYEKYYIEDAEQLFYDNINIFEDALKISEKYNRSLDIYRYEEMVEPEELSTIKEIFKIKKNKIFISSVNDGIFTLCKNNRTGMRISYMEPEYNEFLEITYNDKLMENWYLQIYINIGPWV